MSKELNLKTACWDCPSLEHRKILSFIDRDITGILSDVNEVKRIMEETAEAPQVRCATRAESQGRFRLTLPLLQNLEAFVYGSRMTGEDRPFKPGEYCVETLDRIRDYEFKLTDSPMVRTLIRTISDYSDRGRPPVLEAEAPFSVLAGLMNPVDLYLSMVEERRLLKGILHKIADASAEYIKACTEAGCRIISLADPAGTMDLVGEECYTSVCGEAAVYFMRKCQPYADKAIIHICRKMSQSLLIAGLVKAEPFKLRGITREDSPQFDDYLLRMADDPGIHFTGMTCIHSKQPDPDESCIITV